MDTYTIWKLELLNELVLSKINFGMLGDCITVLDDFGHKVGSIDLMYAWSNDLSYDEIITVLKGEA